MDLIKTFGTNLGTVDEKWTGVEEVKRIKKDIIEQIEKDNEKFIYSHKVRLKLYFSISLFVGKILFILYTAFFNRNACRVLQGNKDGYCLQNDRLCLMASLQYDSVHYLCDIPSFSRSTRMFFYKNTT